MRSELSFPSPPPGGAASPVRPRDMSDLMRPPLCSPLTWPLIPKANLSLVSQRSDGPRLREALDQ